MRHQAAREASTSNACGGLVEAYHGGRAWLSAGDPFSRLFARSPGARGPLTGLSALRQAARGAAGWSLISGISANFGAHDAIGPAHARGVRHRDKGARAGRRAATGLAHGDLHAAQRERRHSRGSFAEGLSAEGKQQLAPC